MHTHTNIEEREMSLRDRRGRGGSTQHTPRAAGDDSHIQGSRRRRTHTHTQGRRRRHTHTHILESPQTPTHIGEEDATHT